MLALDRLDVVESAQPPFSDLSPADPCAPEMVEGLELFRSAICERDPTAWEAVVTRYRGRVAAWIRRHPAAATARGREEIDCWINCVFERFWRAVPPERFGSFPDLPRLLAYLRLCAHSVLLDELRRAQAHGALPIVSLDQEDAEQLCAAGGVEARDVEWVVVDRLTSRELWEAVARELSDQAARHVVYLSFAAGLKPSQIYERFPQRFQDVTDVYRIKRHALRQLRRSPAIQQLIA